MMSKKIKRKLMEISRGIEEKGDKISYILNEGDHYTIGTENYSEKVARYLNQNLEKWNGCKPQPFVQKRKGKEMQRKPKKVGYLWKIPINENNL